MRLAVLATEFVLWAAIWALIMWVGLGMPMSGVELVEAWLR